ncbi:MAG: hypothetical protein ACU84J_10240 [Gammaproteobacteria bacterium]
MLVTVALGMLNANPFNDTTVGPFDLLSNWPGWTNQHIDLPFVHDHHSDVLDYKLPAWRYAKQQFRQGRLPLWSPLAMGGVPSMQLPVYSVVTPAFLFYAMFENDATGFYAAALTNLVILSIGSYLFLFALFPNRTAAWIGAIVFTYCGFNAAWFYWHHVNTSIWIPWLLYFTLCYLNTRNKSYLPGVTAASALMLLGGFPSVAVYGFLVFASLLLIKISVLKEHGISVWLQPILFVALSMLVCAFALQPLYEFLAYADVSYRKGTSPLHLNDFYRFVDPFFARTDIETAVYVGLFPIVGFFAAIGILVRRGYDWAIAWGLLLITVSIAFVFNLIPSDWIRMIPIIGSNPWSRMIVVTALGFSILTSAVIFYSFNAFEKKYNINYVPAIILLALGVFQVLDQHRFFIRFVGSTPDRSVYPMTETIAKVKSEMHPLQNIIADEGYLVSGVLSYYGLGEWFAHGIRPQNNKDLLSKAVPGGFTTRTAAQISCAAIRYSESIITYLNIKNALCANFLANQRRIVISTSRLQGAVPSESIVDNTLEQFFYLPNPIYFNTVEIEIGTHEKQGMSADMFLDFYADNKLITTAFCPAKLLADNTYVRCDLSEGINLVPGNYKLVPRYRTNDATEKLSIWMAPSESKTVFVETNGVRRDFVFHIQLLQINNIEKLTDVYMENGQPQYRILSYEPHILTIENRAVTGSAYFLADLVYGEKPRYDPVKLTAYDDTRIELAYTGNRAGWVVLPMRLYPGWTAMLDGKTVKADRFLDVLPAIQVTGPGRIVYDYFPIPFYVSCVLSLFGVLTTLYFIWRFRR